MNDELKEKGYWVERGKVPVGYFHESILILRRKMN